MRRKPLPKNSAARYEEKIKSEVGKKFILKLYISGNSPKSERAIYNLKKICEEYLEKGYDLEIIDLYQKPELTRELNLIAAPTLIKKLPLPIRRVIGDMSNSDNVLLGLDLIKMEPE